MSPLECPLFTCSRIRPSIPSVSRCTEACWCRLLFTAPSHQAFFPAPPSTAPPSTEAHARLTFVFSLVSDAGRASLLRTLARETMAFHNPRLCLPLFRPRRHAFKICKGLVLRSGLISIWRGLRFRGFSDQVRASAQFTRVLLIGIYSHFSSFI